LAAYSIKKLTSARIAALIKIKAGTSADPP